MGVSKIASKTIFPCSEGPRGFPYMFSTPKPLLNKKFVQKLFPKKFLARKKFSHWVKYGPEVEWVLTLFDPLCPDLASQGPTPLVIRSTFGGLPNHPPIMLVRPSIPDL